MIYMEVTVKNYSVNFVVIVIDVLLCFLAFHISLGMFFFFFPLRSEVSGPPE